MNDILKFPNPVLRETITDFDFTNPILDAKQLEQDLIKVMLSNNGVGLSAIQLGIASKVFVMGHSDSPDTAMAFFNPIITHVSNDTNDMIEGCLSFPGVFVNIKRPREIKACWQDSSGQWQEGQFSGYDAKCFCHEFDHLNGIVMPDRVSQLKWALAVKKSIKARKNKC